MLKSQQRRAFRSWGRKLKVFDRLVLKVSSNYHTACVEKQCKITSYSAHEILMFKCSIFPYISCILQKEDPSHKFRISRRQFSDRLKLRRDQLPFSLPAMTLLINRNQLTPNTLMTLTLIYTALLG